MPDSIPIPPGYDHCPTRAQQYAAIVESAIISNQVVPPPAIDIDVFLVLALMDRESLCGLELSPPGPWGSGDFDAVQLGPDKKPIPGQVGHGRGLCQFDDRAHPDSYVDENGLTNDQWIAQSDDWKDPVANINRCCAQLRWSIQQLAPLCADPSWVVAAAVCSYNEKMAKVKLALGTLQAGYSLDTVMSVLDAATTGHDYVSDVFARRSKFMGGAS